MVASQSAVYSLSLDKPVYVRAYVAEPDLGRVAPGTPVRVRSDSSDKAYQGQVGFVSPRAEFTPKTVETPELRTDLVYRLRVVIDGDRSEEHTSELQSLMRNSYAVFCLKNKKNNIESPLHIAQKYPH